MGYVKKQCSDKTRKMLADALKEQMNKTSFEKISVTDITNMCGFHRQTFYYHFEDKYQLLDWIVCQELIAPLTDGINLDNLYDRLYDLFKTMLDNKKFYQSTFKISFNEISKYISKLATDVFIKVLEDIEKDLGINSVDEENVISAEFFGYGISGVILGWAQKGMKESPALMVERLENIISACKKIVVDRYFSNIKNKNSNE